MQSVWETISRNKKHYQDIPDSEIRKLLAFIKKDRPDYYGITVFIYKCGWRILETTLLRKEDIKWRGLQPVSLKIRAETTKTKTERVFDMFDDALSAILRQNAFPGPKTGWLFPNRNGNPHSPDHYRENYLKRVSKELIGKEITPHYFRHRLCTIAADRGMPINAVRAVTGIKDINVLLQYYEHSTSEGKAKVVGVSRLK